MKKLIVFSLSVAAVVAFADTKYRKRTYSPNMLNIVGGYDPGDGGFVLNSPAAYFDAGIVAPGTSLAEFNILNNICNQHYAAGPDTPASVVVSVKDYPPSKIGGVSSSTGWRVTAIHGIGEFFDGGTPAQLTSTTGIGTSAALYYAEFTDGGAPVWTVSTRYSANSGTQITYANQFFGGFNPGQRYIYSVVDVSNNAPGYYCIIPSLSNGGWNADGVTNVRFHVRREFEAIAP